MSNDIIAFEPNNLPSNLVDKFGANNVDDLITSGGSYPVVSIKGKVWTIKAEGEEIPLLNDEGEPMQSIVVVLVRSSDKMTKNYYAEAYSEGDAESPDCFSHDGIVPDPAAENPQCDSCVTCPMNQWGSASGDSKGKACSDSKTLAIVPADDLYNESLGGPMLLRVPPASLKNLSTFARGMKQKGFVMQQIAVRMGFDHTSAHPKLTFKAVRPMDADEMEIVGELFDSDQVAEILHLPVSGNPTPQAPKQEGAVDDSLEFEEAAPEPASKPKDKAKPKAKAEPKAKAKPTPVEEPPVEGELVDPVAAESPETEAAGVSDIESDIDDILGDLDGI